MSATDDYLVARDERAIEAEKDRRKAEKLWRGLLSSKDPASWKADRILAEAGPSGWAFCERLCDESAVLVESDPDRAEELAALAVTLAPKVPGEKPLVSGIQEYAWLHLGNVCRARGDLARAEQAFHEGKEHFLGSMMGIWPSPIRRYRLEGLSALLLLDEGKSREALEKIGFALQLSSDGDEHRPALFLEKGRMLRRFGRPEEAVKELSRADKLASIGSDSRLALRIAFELGAALCDAGLYGEVKKLPAGLRKAAEALPLERARRRCLDGRVAAGLGRLAEAQAVLDLDPAEFPGKALTDRALLSLEIAVLHAKEGRAAELKSLAESMPQLAEGSGLGREAAAVLKLFCRLAVQDKLPADRATQFLKDFARLSAGR